MEKIAIMQRVNRQKEHCSPIKVYGKDCDNAKGKKTERLLVHQSLSIFHIFGKGKILRQMVLTLTPLWETIEQRKQKRGKLHVKSSSSKLYLSSD